MNRPYPSYTFRRVSFQDDAGNTVTYGPSRLVVEPLDHRQRSLLERALDRAMKSFVVAAALYLLAEVFRAFANGSLPVAR